MGIRILTPSRKKKRAELEDQLSAYGLSIDDAVARLQAAELVAQDMARAGLAELDRIRVMPEADQEAEFNRTRSLTRLYFGEVTHLRQIGTVRHRMAAISNRVRRDFTADIELDKWKKDGTRKTPSAITSGAFNTTRLRMRVYPNLIRSDIWNVAETLLHELGHVWFRDQKLEKVTVYGTTAAQNLAVYNTKKARRSTENYAIFANESHDAAGMRSGVSNPFRRAS